MAAVCKEHKLPLARTLSVLNILVANLPVSVDLHVVLKHCSDNIFLNFVCSMDSYFPIVFLQVQNVSVYVSLMHTPP
jgi:hypothetical protein